MLFLAKYLFFIVKNVLLERSADRYVTASKHLENYYLKNSQKYDWNRLRLGRFF